MFKEKTKHFIENISCDYYMEEFHKIDEGKLTSWNWSAFFFGPAWFMYRKMYLASFLSFVLLNILILPQYMEVVLRTHVEDLLNDYKTYALIFSALLYAVLHGALGNVVYYKRTRSKNNHDSPEKYQPISIILGAYCLCLYVYCFDSILWLRYYMHSEKRYQPGVLTELNAVYSMRLMWLLLYGLAFLYAAINRTSRESLEFSHPNTRLLISPKASWQLLFSALVATVFVVSAISSIYDMGWMIAHYFSK
ncbi:hypothetical protein FACS1894122_07040 [Alphaproteobacteria bacterium]|nr:hypothetical protein FACS1894122_07040 [Alphaproteobacteria bacterium]